MNGQDMDNIGQDETAVWICECGRSNHGNFCVSCGKPREQNQVNQRQKGIENPSELDGLLEQVVNLVFIEGRASTSQIQRHFCIGYPRSMKIIATMVELGILAPKADGGSRRLLMTRDEALTALKRNGKAASVTVQRNNGELVKQGNTPEITGPHQHNSGGTNQWKYALLATGFFVFVAIGFFAVKHVDFGSKTEQNRVAVTTPAQTMAQSGSESSQKTSVQEKEPSGNATPQTMQSFSVQTASQPSLLSVSLGGICIGYRKNEVYSLLGKEKAITDPSKSGHLRYQYPNLEVVITNNVVTGFVSKNAKVETERGIHEGSPLRDVLDAYGNDYSKFTYENATLYEYNMQSIDGKDCLQRFAIKNGRVDYISCRVLDAK